jgi:release factor glutamine methyltransferase
MQIRALLQQATEALIQSASPRIDAEIILGHCLKVPRSYLYMHSEQELTQAELAEFQALFIKRQQGVPIAYLMGQREFWSLNLTVTPATLIPRPETELLVELALANIPMDAGIKVADLGTGSGAIALAIAKERPQAFVYAVDKSLAALQVAKLNARHLSISNVIFLTADWLTAFAPAAFDIIVSNPPYIAEHDPHLAEGDVRFEPTMALVAGHDGLAAYRTIIKQAKQILRPKGWLLFEHGYRQANQLKTLMQLAEFNSVQTKIDLAGQERITLAQKK